jgi:hypothetical protein
MTAQQGMLLFSSNNELPVHGLLSQNLLFPTELERQVVQKVGVSMSKRQHLLKMLDREGINSETMYPDVDCETCVSIKRSLHLDLQKQRRIARRQYYRQTDRLNRRDIKLELEQIERERELEMDLEKWYDSQTGRPQFDDARLKIKRATKHMQEMKDALERLPGCIQLSLIPKGDGAVVKFDVSGVEAVRRDVAVIAGDAMNNLKSALDYAWIGLLDRHQIPAPNRPKFPVYANRSELVGYLKSVSIPENSQPFTFMADDLRPFEEGNCTIRALHLLNNQDKHQLLLPTVSYGNVEGLKALNTLTGEIEEGGTLGFDIGGSVEVYFQSTYKVKEMGTIPISFLMGKGSSYESVGIYDALRDFHRNTLYAVTRMETL